MQPGAERDQRINGEQYAGGERHDQAAELLVLKRREGPRPGRALVRSRGCAVSEQYRLGAASCRVSAPIKVALKPAPVVAESAAAR